MNDGRGIVVVGSAHLDVIADYWDSAVLDKPGSVQFSIGGSAFNMAVDLARRGRRTYLLTVLKRGSLVTPLILTKLHAAGVKIDYIRSISSLEHDGRPGVEDLPASGFVGHRINGQLASAVTSCLVESLQFARGSPEALALGKAVKRCEVVVADANLNPLGLLAVLQESANLGRPVVLAAVSEKKIQNIVAIPSAAVTAAVVCANELEVASLDPAFFKLDLAVRIRDAGRHLDEHLSEPAYVDAMCKSLHAHAVAITKGEGGASIYFQAGGRLDLGAPLVKVIVSRTGAGDAFAAALIACIEQRGRPLAPDSETLALLSELIYEFVPPVLAQQTATQSASLDLDMEEQVRARAPLSRLAIFVRDTAIQYGFSKAAEAVVVTVLLAIGAALLGSAYRIVVVVQGYLGRHFHWT